MLFTREIGEIYRLKVPFDGIYTSVFLIKTPTANLLIDCASYDSDIDEYLIPALNDFGLQITDIAYLVLTHLHSDHAGGVKRIKELHPTIKVIQDGVYELPSGVSVYELKGHTIDCIGVFDRESGTLISGDGLQGESIGRYRCSLESRVEYLKTLDKIQADRRIQNILLSHAYEPWRKDGAFGREEVEKRIKDCRKIIGE